MLRVRELIKLITDEGQEVTSGRFPSDGQNGSSEFDQVEDVQVLTSGELSCDPFRHVFALLLALG